ncbi:erv26 super protein [Chytriomyces hyalinus]|nr:erv26 super protein [Chytriomyces hyalinus]KAJ3264612.1 erv26 super protein [Chytriomyces hyalinus]KAJ3398133.1 erv26 super protein [Chytriomyces hyalinus]
MSNLRFIHLLVYVGGALGFVFLVLSLASGLYYLAEVIEENTVIAKKVLKYTIYTVIGCHVILAVHDEFSWLRIAISIGCHLVYSLLLQNFPNVQLDDPYFILTCILAVVDHFMWFFWFADSHHYHRFMDIAAFFGLMVWLVPFAFFISLSANENTLPAFDASSASSRGESKKKTNLVKGLMNLVLQKSDLLPVMSPSGSRKDYKQF